MKMKNPIINHIKTISYIFEDYSVIRDTPHSMVMTLKPVLADHITRLVKRFTLLLSIKSNFLMWMNKDLALVASQFPSYTAFPLSPQRFCAFSNPRPVLELFSLTVQPSCLHSYCWSSTLILGFSLDIISWYHITKVCAPFKHGPCTSLLSNLTFAPWRCMLCEGKQILSILVNLRPRLRTCQMVKWTNE